MRQVIFGIAGMAIISLANAADPFAKKEYVVPPIPLAGKGTMGQLPMPAPVEKIAQYSLIGTNGNAALLRVAAENNTQILVWCKDGEEVRALGGKCEFKNGTVRIAGNHAAVAQMPRPMVSLSGASAQIGQTPQPQQQQQPIK